MKKLTLFLLLLFTVSALSAQSDKPRKASELESMAMKIINEQNYKSTNRVFSSPPYWDEISLKYYIDSIRYNSIEYGLLQQYSDVIVSPYFHCYFTIADNGDIGVVNLDGDELLPPISESLKQIGFWSLAGDVTTKFDTSLSNISKNNLSYNVAYPLGLCKSVLRFSRKGVNTIIPLDKYSYISAIPIGEYVFRVRGFYVCKFDDNNNLVWGLCDKNGQEIIECKYKGIIFEKGKFIGTNDMDMQDIVNIYDEIVGIKQVRRQNRDATIAAIAEIGNEIGSAMIEVGSNIQQSQSGSSNGSAGASTGGSSSKSSAGGGTHPGMSRSELQQRYNAEIQTIRRLRDSWAEHIGTHGEVVNQNTLRDCKANIQSIKNSAAQHGITLQTDPLENWTPAK